MKTPTEIIAERIGAHEAKAVIDLLRESGWLIFRHDAIRLAQAHAANDNWLSGDMTATTLQIRQAMQTGGRV